MYQILGKLSRFFQAVRVVIQDKGKVEVKEDERFAARVRLGWEEGRGGDFPLVVAVDGNAEASGGGKPDKEDDGSGRAGLGRRGNG